MTMLLVRPGLHSQKPNWQKEFGGQPYIHRFLRHQGGFSNWTRSPVVVIVAKARVIAPSIAPHVHHPLVRMVPRAQYEQNYETPSPLIYTCSGHATSNPKSSATKESCPNS